MSRLHLKGYVLALLRERGQMWDYEVVEAVDREYGLGGAYWAGTVRLNLVDLYACGLITELEATVDPTHSDGVERILFRYELTDFGRERMEQSGLTGAAA